MSKIILKSMLGCVFVCFVGGKAFASGVACATSIDSNNNMREVQCNKSTYWSDADDDAKKILRGEGYKNVMQLCYKQNISSGYIVIVQGNKNPDGTHKTTMGCGISTSRNEAENKAVEGIPVNDWGWRKVDGYSVTKTITF